MIVRIESGCGPQNFHIEVKNADLDSRFPKCWEVSDMYAVHVAFSEFFKILKEQGQVGEVRVKEEAQIAGATEEEEIEANLTQFFRGIREGELEIVEALLRMDDDTMREGVRKWREKLIERTKS